MKKVNNIFLIGPMGAGKTSIGKLLSKELGLLFLDTDHEIEKRTGVDIPWIFDVEGEEGFRKREREVVKELVERQGIILSTGGGTIVDSESRNFLAARGVVVYLHATVGQQYERIYKDTKRPLVSSDNPQEALKNLFAERDSLYREIADAVFETDDKSVHRVVKDIIDFLEANEYRL